MKRIILAVMAVTMLVGCGGGGSTISAPVISVMKYAPQSVQVGPADVSINGSVNYTSEADIVTIRMTDSRGGDFTIPVAGGTGIRNGIVTMPPSPLVVKSAGTYSFTVWLVDNAGNNSNQLVGNIAITSATP